MQSTDRIDPADGVVCYPRLSSASLKKRRSPTLRSRIASVARCAAGRHAKKISGSAPADTGGTPSTLEASAQRAFTSGLKLSASRAADGRRILSGMPNDDVALLGAVLSGGHLKRHNRDDNFTIRVVGLVEDIAEG